VWPQIAHFSPPLAAQESRSCSQEASSRQYTHMRGRPAQGGGAAPRHDTFFLAHSAQVEAGASVSVRGSSKMASITWMMSGFA
jgi:hypothetical protein